MSSLAERKEQVNCWSEAKDFLNNVSNTNVDAKQHLAQLVALDKALTEQERVTKAAEAGLLLETEFLSSKRIRVLKLCEAYAAHSIKTASKPGGQPHPARLLNHVREVLKTD